LGGDFGGEGRDSRKAQFAGARGHEGNFERGEPGQVSPAGTLKAAGAGQNLVPPQYRQRVGAYLERVNDEIGERREKARR
jgi:hypothetical protein